LSLRSENESSMVGSFSGTSTKESNASLFNTTGMFFFLS